MLRTKSNRIEWLDALKAVCILLVVFCHYELIPGNSIFGNILMCCAWGAVPCFMMVSGSLMHRSKAFSWKKYLQRLLKTYLVLCVWRVIYLLVYAGIGKLTLSKILVFKYLFLFGDIPGVNTGLMWYIIAYLLVLLVYPVTWFLFNNSKSGRPVLAFTMVLAGVSGILIPSANWLLSWIARSDIRFAELSLTGLKRIMPYDNYANMLFYFILGAFLFEYRDRCGKKLRVFFPLMLVSGIALLVLIRYADTGLFTWGSVFLQNGYAHLATGMLSAGLYMTFAVFPDGWGNKVLGRLLGQYTMGVYYLHYVMLGICNAFLFRLITANGVFLWMNFAKTFIIAVVSVLVTVILRKIPVLRELVS